MKRTHLTLVAFATALLLCTGIGLRAQRAISAIDLIHDMDKDLSNLVEKFARTLHHQGEGQFGANESTALMAMAAFAGQMHALHAVAEHAPQAQMTTMLQLMDGTLQQADRAVRRGHIVESVRNEWDREVDRYQALRQAYGLAPSVHVRWRHRGD